MAGEVELGLYLVADNPNLTFIVFIGLVLLTVIAARFGAYAYLNMRATGVDAQRVLWEYLLYVGAVAALYGVVGILEIVSSIRTPYKTGLVLAVVLLLALSVREIYFNAALSTTGADGAFPGRRFIEVAFVAVVAAVVFGIARFGLRRPLLALQGVGALAFAGYGFWFGRKQTAAAMVQGTMIDSLLRHLLPVLAFATLVPAVDIATVAGLDRVVVQHVQIVFVIMTATALMTATIKLRQNLVSL
ncbi:hypothetical protein I7X12_15470 [Halosimplex litoreum]|uniref:Uncharacterized protein n=1 Tax=Halosimplex litoreum TaxID=1198301 RepID=A0A7T3FWQ7_9EURY|nr:hypothetical protein [Halosimplex litoreum]QPV62131.1 hypothetical protein I7X12_15470 [Halosimplex litoreum]